MVAATLTGKDPGAAAADALTGYVEGRGTWQFKMLLALADMQLNVINHELFDFERFTSDPVGAIRAQVKDELVTQGILQETDIDAEVAAVRQCLKNPKIKLINQTPSVDDLCQQIELGRHVVCNVNLQVLKSKPKREGHVMLIEHIDGNEVIAHDPGPEGGLGCRFERDLFMQAWMSPSAALANYISVWK
jgi:hypothetical protein